MKNNNSYKNFSEYYDNYIALADYEMWADYIKDLSTINNPNTILDIGCGSGYMMLFLSDILNGDFYGMDISGEMLVKANENAYYEEKDFRFMKADMKDFVSDISFDFIYSVCDSINYLQSENDLLQTFKNIKKYLNKGGSFTFDIISEYYKPENEILENEGLTFDVRRSKKDNWLNTTIIISNTKERLCKVEHKQRIFSVNTINEALKEAGFENVFFYDFLTKDKPNEESEKIQAVAY